MIEPNLDRFAWKGPNEPRGVKSLLETDECEVCGQDAHPSFLQSWNGKDVCRYCIREINEESESFANHD